MASLIERLEGALVKFKDRKDKLRHPNDDVPSDPVVAARDKELKNS